MSIHNHGTDLYIAKQHEVFGAHQTDLIHVPVDAMLAIHRFEWQEQSDVVPGLPGHWQPIQQDLVHSRKLQDFYNLNFRPHESHQPFKVLPDIPTVHDKKYYVAIADCPTQCTYEIQRNNGLTRLANDATQFAQHSCQDNHPLFRPGLHYCIILLYTKNSKQGWQK